MRNSHPNPAWAVTAAGEHASPNVTERVRTFRRVLRRRDMASAGGAIPVNRRSRCHEQALTVPEITPAGAMVTIGYSRLTEVIAKELWRDGPVRRRWSRPHRNEHAVRNLSSQLAGSRRCIWTPRSRSRR
jgi:hypothetical protein